MRRVEIVFFDAGGGHRSAANALKYVIQQKDLPWEVNLMNLQELLDSMDVFRKVTRIRLQDLYNLMLKKGWTLGSGPVARRHARRNPPLPRSDGSDAA